MRSWREPNVAQDDWAQALQHLLAAPCRCFEEPRQSGAALARRGRRVLLCSGEERPARHDGGERGDAGKAASCRCSRNRKMRPCRGAKAAPPAVRPGLSVRAIRSNSIVAQGQGRRGGRGRRRGGRRPASVSGAVAVAWSMPPVVPARQRHSEY
jgi:hypothetical protein